MRKTFFSDINEQKLYWTNTGSQNIQSMTSDGKDVKTVISYSHYPYGIDGYNGYIYWSQSRNGIIKRADKSGGSSSSWSYTRPYGVVGVKVYDGGNVIPTEHVCTTEGLSSVIFQTTTQDGESVSPADHVRTNEGLSGVMTIFQTIQDGENVSPTDHVRTTEDLSGVMTIFQTIQDGENVSPTDHVRTTEGLSGVMTIFQTIQDGENVSPTDHVRTTEGLSGVMTIFQTIQDDKKSILAIALVIVLLVFSIVVIGLMYSKVKSNNTRPNIDVTRDRCERKQHDDQRIERQVWMTRDKIRGDLEIHFLDF
ncbi:LRP2 [Mytilus coruscus]|uniref:LRP2 n=1 Tax=Mytilus coruscus TaxID=42192 RepID=A0A6J8EBG2_MYTCO|nr:LRP2 [Mytilus coruscus]